MALKDYYNSLSEISPRSEFRRRIVKECDVNLSTAFRWISGEVIPEKLKREKIAEVTGIPVEELFPNLTQDCNETV